MLTAPPLGKMEQNPAIFQCKDHIYYWLNNCVYPVDWGRPGEYKLDICVYPIDWGGPGEYKLVNKIFF